MTYEPPAAGSRLTTLVTEGMVGVWEDYTPVWTATGTAPSIGSGTLTGRSVTIGTTVHFIIKLTGASDTTWGTGSYSWTLPVAAAASTDFVGDLFVGDSSAGSSAYSTGIAFVGASGTTVGGYVGAKNGAAAVTSSNPQTFASGDRIWLAGTYEMA